MMIGKTRRGRKLREIGRDWQFFQKELIRVAEECLTHIIQNRMERLNILLISLIQSRNLQIKSSWPRKVEITVRVYN